MLSRLLVYVGRRVACYCGFTQTFLTGSKSGVLVMTGAEEMLTGWFGDGMNIIAEDGALGNS